MLKGYIPWGEYKRMREKIVAKMAKATGAKPSIA